ncbi:MAG: glycosyltransferase family 4 protein [Acidobacteriota bacterium]
MPARNTMRILIAHEAPAGGGGVESYLAAIMPALAARGHDLAFLHHNSRSEHGPTEIGYPGIPTASIADDGLDAGLARMRGWHPDVCFSHNLRQLFVEERLTAFVPVVKMMHGYFGTCISGQKAHAFPGVQPCGRVFGAACLALFMPRRCGQLRPLLMIEQYGWSSRQRRMFDRYAQVVVASSHMAREYARHGVAADRLVCAPLFPTIAQGGSPRQPPVDPVVLFAGRMTRLKGGDVLVRAVAIANRALARPARIVFAGVGPEQPHWEGLARELGVSATFHGWVTGADRIAVLRSATLVAVPSLWPEPFGLIGLEAAVQGVPAVAFDVGGIGEWLHDGVNGRMVHECASAEALGATIASMLSTPGEIDRLGVGALGVAASLGIDAHLDILERVFVRAAESQARIPVGSGSGRTTTTGADAGRATALDAPPEVSRGKELLVTASTP